jgi:hypothetical protein
MTRRGKEALQDVSQQRRIHTALKQTDRKRIITTTENEFFAVWDKILADKLPHSVAVTSRHTEETQ